MAGKHRNTGKHHRTPQPQPQPRSRRLTLRTTSGLLAGASVIGLAVGSARMAFASEEHPEKGTTLAALVPDAKVGLPDGLRVDGEGGEDGGGSSSRTLASKGEDGGKDGAAGPRVPAARPGTVKPSAQATAIARKKPTAQDAIKLARSQVGIEEDRRGETKFQEWYVKTERAKETAERDGGRKPGIYGNAAWCSMFVSWVGDRIGFADQLGMDAYTVEHAKWFQKQHRWGTRPRPGAIVFFAWNGGKSISDIAHVGMVIKYEGRGRIQTVEGNTSNAVRVRERTSATVVGYGYPDYAKG